MTEKNGFRIDVLTVGEAEDKDIEILVRGPGGMATFRLLEILTNQLDKSKDYDANKLDFIRSLINTGHHLTA